MCRRRTIAERVMTIAVVSVAMLVAASIAGAQKSAGDVPPTRVMIDRSLSRSPVRVTGYAGASVSFVLEQAWPSGTVRTKQLADVAAIIGAGERTDPARAGASLVELVDGTRLFGSLEQPTEGDRSGESAIAHATSIGDVSFDLDHLSRLVFDATAECAPLAPGDADVVELANGDRMEGLVASLWPLVVEDAADASKKTELTPDRVRQIVMSNKRRESGLSRVWLRDGSIVNVSSFVKSDGGELAGEARVDGNDGVLRLRAGADRVLALVMSGTKLVPLSEIPVSAYRPGAGRRWAPGPSVVGGSSGALGGTLKPLINSNPGAKVASLGPENPPRRGGPPNTQRFQAKVAKWQSGEVAKWQSGRVEERSGRVVEWSSERGAREFDRWMGAARDLDRADAGGECEAGGQVRHGMKRGG
jgi:hypothetical protein